MLIAHTALEVPYKINQDNWGQLYASLQFHSISTSMPRVCQCEVVHQFLSHFLKQFLLFTKTNAINSLQSISTVASDAIIPSHTGTSVEQKCPHSARNV